MMMSGKLIDNKIIVEKPKDIGRLYNKSRIGKTVSGNKLELDLLEGVFLLEDEKIRIFQDKKEIKLDELIKLAIRIIPDFEIKYLVYKDLRNRGHTIKLCKDEKTTTLNHLKQKFLTYTFSERDLLDIDETKKIIKDAEKENKELWFGIVDEEGDITYYKVALLDLKGKNKENVFRKSTGVLLKNRVIIFNKDVSNDLFNSEFYGKPFGKGLQLSLVEAMYLVEKGFIEIQNEEGKKIQIEKLQEIIQKSQPDFNLRIIVFRDLKKRGLIVKTGFKFGSHFRVYTSKPDDTHAEYLVHVVSNGFKSSWDEVSRAVRLAHSVNKEIIFARVDKEKIDYINFGRLRP
jgi:tRNA-intron endonuclease